MSSNDHMWLHLSFAELCACVPVPSKASQIAPNCPVVFGVLKLNYLVIFSMKILEFEFEIILLQFHL